MTSALPPSPPQKPSMSNSIRMRRPAQLSYFESKKTVALSKPSEMQRVRGLSKPTMKRASSLPSGKQEELPRESRKLFWFLPKQREIKLVEKESSKDDFYFPFASFKKSKKEERFILPRRSQYPTLSTLNSSDFSADGYGHTSGHTECDEEDLLGLSFCDDDDDDDDGDDGDDYEEVDHQ
jgi:hypothetical protein